MRGRRSECESVCEGDEVSEREWECVRATK